MRDTFICAMLGHWHAGTNHLMVLPSSFRQVPQQSRLQTLFPPAAPPACSLPGTVLPSPSAKPTTVRVAELQEELQHSTQLLLVQQGLAASPGIISHSFQCDTLIGERAVTEPAGAHSAVGQAHGNTASHYSVALAAASEEQGPDSMQSALFGSSPAQSAGPSAPGGPFPESHASSHESAMASQLCAQPEAYGYSQSQLGDQQWSALFLQAYMQTEAQSMQPGDNAALHLAPGEGPSSIGQQPVELSEGFLELPADAGSLQHHTSYDCDDGQKSLGGDGWPAAFMHGQELQGGGSWLAAFTEAHLQGSLSNMQRADSDQASEDPATSSEETDPEGQSVASSSDDQTVSDFDDESDGDYDEEEGGVYDEESSVNSDNDESDADSEDEALSVHNQLRCTLKGRVQRLASSAVGWGYHAAGAVYGSVLGLKQGLRKSS